MQILSLSVYYRTFVKISNCLIPISSIKVVSDNFVYKKNILIDRWRLCKKVFSFLFAHFKFPHCKPRQMLKSRTLQNQSECKPINLFCAF